MRRRARASGTPLSLFSFQDVITSITGIMILVVLLRVLDVISRKSIEAVQRLPQGPEVIQLQSEIAALEEEHTGLKELVDKGRGEVADLSGIDLKQLRETIIAEEDRGKTLAKNLNRETEEAKKLENAAKQAEGAAEDLARAIKAMQGQARELEAQVAAPTGVKPRVFYEPAPGLSKTPVLVQCSDKGVEAKVLGRTPEVRSFIQPGSRDHRASLSAFLAWARSLDKNRMAFFALVKPSAAPYADKEVIGKLRAAGFDVGYDPFDEEKTAIFEERR